MKPIYASLKVAKPTEVRQDWSQVTQSLPVFAQWIARTFAVDLTDLLSKNELIYVGSSEPTGEDKGKIWIKNTNPPGIGIPFSDTYVVIYPFPPNSPVLWTGGSANQPGYVRKLSDTELEQFGLTDPESSEYYYVILEP